MHYGYDIYIISQFGKYLASKLIMAARIKTHVTQILIKLLHYIHNSSKQTYSTSLQWLWLKKHYNRLDNTDSTMNKLKWQDVIFTDIPYISTSPPRFL